MPNATLTFTTVDYYYASDKPVLNAINLKAPAGTATTVVGLSGHGKSTLLRLAAGMLKPRSGTVRVNDVDVEPRSGRAAAVFQNYDLTVFSWLTVRENLELANFRRRRDEDFSTRLVDIAQTLGIEHALERKGGELSGGEKQRAAVARTLLQNAALVLFDEPFASVDPIARNSVIAVIRWMVQEVGRTVVVVTHDIEEGVAAADRVYCLRGASNCPQLVEVPYATKVDAVDVITEMLTEDRMHEEGLPRV